MADTKDTESCFICQSGQNLAQSSKVTSQIGKTSFPICGKHDQAGIKAKIQQAMSQQFGPSHGSGSGEEVQQHHHDPASSRTPLAAPTEGQEQSGQAAASPSKEPPETQAYRPADYLVQNLPTGTGEVSPEDPQLSEEDKILQLSYAYSQLEVATSALARAYDTLKDSDKEKLPVRTLKQRMRKVREVAKEMVAMADAGESGGQDGDKEEKTE